MVRGSVEETLNELLEKEAESLTQAARYERSETRQGYRSGHYNRNLTTTSGDVTLHVPRLKGVSFDTTEIYYYGDDLNDALVYLEEFAPDIERSEFESRVCSLFENKWMMKKLNIGIKKALGLWVDKPYRKPSDIRCLCVKCLEDYKSSPNYIVKRLDPFARVKEKCDKCEGYGYDYLVIERSKEGR